jgi:hypothetical protein
MKDMSKEEIKEAKREVRSCSDKRFYSEEGEHMQQAELD